MKKLFFFFSFFPLLVTGQNWSKNGATWYYGFAVWSTAGYYKIEYTGDTTINAVQCKKLLKTVYSEDLAFNTYDTTVAGVEYTYSDADRVYIFRHNKFYTLYDFSAQVGSIWTVPEVKRYNGCDTVGTIRVDSIGTMTISNQNLRYICVSIMDSSQKWGWNAKIVERIGPVKSFGSYDYLLPQKYDYCGMMLDEISEGGSFRCYSDNTGFLYSSGIAPACDFIISVSPVSRILDGVKVFPNPSRGFLEIDFNGYEIREVRLTDMLQRTVISGQASNQSKITFDDLPAGTYILTLTDKENRTVNKKIISCPQ